MKRSRVLTIGPSLVGRQVAAWILNLVDPVRDQNGDIIYRTARGRACLLA